MLLAAPLVLEAAAPSEAPGWVAAPSAAPALVARADDRVSGSSPLRSVWAGLEGAAPATERRTAVSAQRAGASALALGPLQRWLLSHATTTSLP